MMNNQPLGLKSKKTLQSEEKKLHVCIALQLQYTNLHSNLILSVCATVLYIYIATLELLTLVQVPNLRLKFN
jgi:hypothetical protein